MKKSQEKNKPSYRAMALSLAITIRQHKTKIAAVTLAVAILVAGWFLVFPPVSFPEGRLVTIEEGSTLTEIAEHLKDKGMIHSRTVFKGFVELVSDEGGVLAGDYLFENSLPPMALAMRLTKGEFGIEPVRVTLFEGLSIYEMAESLAKQFSDFDPIHFLNLAEGKEGYLFPDTYFFLPNVEEDQVLKELEDNFEAQISSIAPDIEASGKTLEEIIVMASIIEKEAWKTHDQRLISGVLWKRLDIGMPLQVDATFAYVNGKNTYELTYDDLEIDSPYNTYKYRGLPAGPIANPGLDAIRAAIEPEYSDYLFYLADREGNTYYAETFEGHKQNRALYMN